MSVAAYKSTIREVQSPRDIERRVLARVTFELEKHAQDFDRANGNSQRLQTIANGLGAALAENQEFWSALKHDLAEPENGLPADLRASLISLALWVERQTHKITAGNGLVAPLVTVNRSISAGLSQAPAPAMEGA